MMFIVLKVLQLLQITFPCHHEDCSAAVRMRICSMCLALEEFAAAALTAGKVAERSQFYSDFL